MHTRPLQMDIFNLEENANLSQDKCLVLKVKAAMYHTRGCSIVQMLLIWILDYLNLKLAMYGFFCCAWDRIVGFYQTFPRITVLIQTFHLSKYILGRARYRGLDNREPAVITVLHSSALSNYTFFNFIYRRMLMLTWKEANQLLYIEDRIPCIVIVLCKIPFVLLSSFYIFNMYV